MCGRYALALRPSAVRRHLQDSNMPTQEAPDDDVTRQTYNFAPGYYGLVYRADVPDHGAGGSQHTQQSEDSHDQHASNEDTTEHPKVTDETNAPAPEAEVYKLQAMKWGLVPFWTKRNPDYGSTMKTINCRDDSLATPGGMWNTMKQKKRCIVIAQGFYEWLKKNGGKDKIPHYVKRKDGQLMCLAGLWDCVQYEDSPSKLYTYTIITTDSNPQLHFLHDRMPVILEPGSPALFTWLSPTTSTWTKDLQSLLQPFSGELECYPVVKEVGKVGNNSPTFVVPLDSKENKQNIMNFFGGQKKAAKTDEGAKEAAVEEEKVLGKKGEEVQQDPKEDRKTIDDDGNNTEDNAPKPVPAAAGHKRQHEEDDAEKHDDDNDDPTTKHADKKPHHTAIPPTPTPKKQSKHTPSKLRSKSATTNNTAANKSPTKAADGSEKITSFFAR